MNFKANHNGYTDASYNRKDVCYLAKNNRKDVCYLAKI